MLLDHFLKYCFCYFIENKSRLAGGKWLHYEVEKLWSSQRIPGEIRDGAQVEKGLRLRFGEITVIDSTVWCWEHRVDSRKACWREVQEAGGLFDVNFYVIKHSTWSWVEKTGSLVMTQSAAEVVTR